MPEEKHHPFSPSVLERRAQCPASFRMEQECADLPEETSPDAKEGTRLHALIADALKQYWKDGIIPEDAEEPVRKALECFKRNIPEKAETIYDFMGKTSVVGVNRNLFIESRLELVAFGETYCYGTADAIVVYNIAQKNESSGEVEYPTHAVLFDWKTGHQTIPDALCRQGGMYCAMAAGKFKCKHVEAIFYNPTLDIESSAIYDERDFFTTIEDFYEIKNRCEAPDAPFCPGNACTYCKAKKAGRCPVAWKAQEEALTIANAGEVIRLENMPDESLADFMRKCSLVADLAEAVKAEIGKRAIKNGQCAGWEWKRTSGGKEITNIPSAWAQVCDTITQEEFFTACKVSVPTLKKVYARKKKDTAQVQTLKGGEELFDFRMQGIISDRPDKLTLVDKGKQQKSHELQPVQVAD